MTSNSGYHPCPCRDCFEGAIGALPEGGLRPDDPTQPDLCHECADAGCDPTGESECECDLGTDGLEPSDDGVSWVYCGDLGRIGEALWGKG